MSDSALRLGWIGTGRMGYAMVSRLLRAGHEVAVYNRTRSKAEPLAELGARIVDTIGELSDCDVVFTMVSASDDYIEVTTGSSGVVGGSQSPRILVDFSTVSAEATEQVIERSAGHGVAVLAAPVSGNAKAVAAGRLAVVVSGPSSAFEEVRPLLETVAAGVTYVGEGSVARMVKIAHNVLLAVLTEAMAEVTVLAEKGGVQRSVFLDFLNKSVLGSTFTRYKTPAFVHLDLTPTFTSELLRKDLDLGLSAAEGLGVPMPATELTRSLVDRAIDYGHGQDDFAALLVEAARAAGMQLAPEDVEVSDGLSD
ncbi:NAD(P)-dependent oxidoreductase [Flindersiella endophytica]